MLATNIVGTEGKLVYTLYCFTAVVLTMMAALALEQSSRHAFLLSRKLETMAMTDPLTGLGNRRFFEDRTMQFWGRLPSDLGLASLILIDIDHFKLYNDSCGHSAGDLCLKRIGGCVTGALRHDIDVAVRFGGEVIVVFLPDQDFPEARSIAERIRQAIVTAGILHPGTGPDTVVTASMGVATAHVAECTTSELVILADMALYSAKHAGRNRVWPPIAQDCDDQLWDEAFAFQPEKAA